MSRFISAGTNEDPPDRHGEWMEAQQEIEANRRRKDEEKERQDGKSLYEVLQANKAAKQEAFEESIRLKNQFRSLDDDEVDFLDSVLESTRAKDAAIKKETTEQLDAFRSQQEEAERSGIIEESDAYLPGSEKKWLVSGRKRKKGRDNEVQRAVKLRRPSPTAAEHFEGPSAKMLADTQIQKAPTPQHNNLESTQTGLRAQDAAELAAGQQDALVPPRITSNSPPLPGLGLGAYSSDED